MACASGPRGAARLCTGAAPTGAPAALPSDVPVFDHLGAVVGTVRDAASGRALAGAAVTLTPTVVPASAAASAPKRADRAGGFVVVAVPGDGALTAHAEGYEPATRAVVLRAERAETVHVALHALPCRTDTGAGAP